jgi:thioesterase domain-containing protein
LAHAIDCHRQIIPIDWTRKLDRLPSRVSVAEIATYVVASLRAVRAAGPYLLAGIGAEGLLAYEAAVQLTAAGEMVDQVVMLNAAVSGSGPMDQLSSLMTTSSVKDARRRLRLAARDYSPSAYSGKVTVLTQTNSAVPPLAASHWKAASALEVRLVPSSLREVASGIERAIAETRPPRAARIAG